MDLSIVTVIPEVKLPDGTVIDIIKPKYDLAIYLLDKKNVRIKDTKESFAMIKECAIKILNNNKQGIVVTESMVDDVSMESFTAIYTMYTESLINLANSKN